MPNWKHKDRPKKISVYINIRAKHPYSDPYPYSYNSYSDLAVCDIIFGKCIMCDNMLLMSDKCMQNWCKDEHDVFL